MLQTQERIRAVEKHLSDCLIGLLADSSDETLNRLIVSFDELEAVFPRLYCQLRGQNLMRALIDLSEQEFQQRKNQAA